MQNFSRYIPLLGELKHYTRQDFLSDVFAGSITAIVLVPQGIAYAMLAGLPAQVGLYSSILPPIIYAFLGSSRTLSVGPVSIVAIMVASVLSAPELHALGSPLEHAIILAAAGGLVLLLMAVLGMGGLANFISRPVLRGFASGIAILIVLSQIPNLLGLASNQCGIQVNCYFAYVLQANRYTAGLGVASLVLLWLLGSPLLTTLSALKIKTTIATGISKCTPLLAVIISTAIVIAYQLSAQHNVAIVGHIPSGLPTLSVRFISNINQWNALLPSAIVIAIIAYVESIAIAKAMESMSKQKINPNQELVALGAANIAAACSGGMFVAGGFSRTMMNFFAGARTQMAMLFAVFLLSIAVIFFTDWLTYIPRAVLAAIVLIAIFPLIKLRDIVKTWQYDRGDGFAELLTLCGVLIFGIEAGIAAGVAITILSFLRKTSRPHIALVGRIEGSEHFRNVKRHQVETWNNLILIRIDENISFANASYIVDFIQREVKNHPPINQVVLIFSAVSHVDTTAFEALTNLVCTLKDQSIVLNLAEVKGPVMDKLKQTRFLDQLSPGKVFFQTIEAIEALGNSKAIKRG